jgi:hypothetical protein
MSENNLGTLFEAYDETTIEVFQPQEWLQDLGWDEYFVITAWNPESQELALSENRTRNAELEEELLAKGAELLKAIGRSNDWKWFEESFAVRKMSLGEMTQLATKYQQNAIFHITSEGKKVISCIA